MGLLVGVEREMMLFDADVMLVVIVDVARMMPRL